MTMKLRLPRIGIHARISVALVSLFLALLVGMDIAFGIFPNPVTSELKARQRMAYILAATLTQGDSDSASGISVHAVRAVAQRDPEVLSAAFRDASGVVYPIIGDHDRFWTLAPGAPSTASEVRVQIAGDNASRGQLEIAFKPLREQTLRGFVAQPLVRGLSMLGVCATALVYFYLRRALKRLDPGRIVAGRVRDAFDVLQQGVLVLDLRHRVMMVNDAFLRMCPTDEAPKMGHPVAQFDSLLAALGADATEPPWERALRQGATTAEQLLVIGDGAATPQRHVTIEATPVLDHEERARGTLVTLTDVSSLHRLNRDLEQTMASLNESRETLRAQNEDLVRLATRDPLTNCLNRRAFFESGGAVFADRRERSTIGCIMVDIDHFKSFNDRYGHAVGDEVIKAVAQVLSEMTRSDDMVCRYGGEEFCVLIKQQQPNGTMQLAERIRTAIEETAAQRVEGTPGLRITASLGTALIDDGVTGLQHLINRADMGLYASKRNGRNRVTPWSAEFEERPVLEKG
jgi:diguanylate cyclase (GGDEF)-like protein